MNWKFFTSTLILLTLANRLLAQPIVSPEKQYGQLFRDVQLQMIFPDGKVFPDCIPKRDADDILHAYATGDTGVNLATFVTDNFELPPPAPQLNYIQQEKDLAVHMNNLWSVLEQPGFRQQGHRSGTLLALPYPYIVPGGKFREMHYWDSYFIMLGLKASGHVEMLENMVKDFAWLIGTYGHIPAGSRSYYQGRTGPPVFSLMVALLAGVKGKTVFKTYLPAMEKEYRYWMDGSSELKGAPASRHLFKMDDGTLLNRYWDADTTLRPEFYKEDHDIAEKAANDLAMRIRATSPEALQRVLAAKRAAVTRHLRAASASGWNLSSRWLADEKNVATIQASDIVPVDLNCLLYLLEVNISKANKLTHHKRTAAAYAKKAAVRKAAILKYCWSGKLRFFCDYNALSKACTERVTAAGLFPLFASIATTEQAVSVSAITKEQLLKAGGVETTIINTGREWDAPNGVAALQWIAVTGLSNYGYRELAKDISNRWLSLNDKVYNATGNLLDAYDVEGLSTDRAAGVPQSQYTYGSTGGVYLALKKHIP